MHGVSGGAFHCMGKASCGATVGGWTGRGFGFSQRRKFALTCSHTVHTNVFSRPHACTWKKTQNAHSLSPACALMSNSWLNPQIQIWFSPQRAPLSDNPCLWNKVRTVLWLNLNSEIRCCNVSPCIGLLDSPLVTVLTDVLPVLAVFAFESNGWFMSLKDFSQDVLEEKGPGVLWQERGRVEEFFNLSERSKCYTVAKVAKVNQNQWSQFWSALE